MSSYALDRRSLVDSEKAGFLDSASALATPTRVAAPRFRLGHYRTRTDEGLLDNYDRLIEEEGRDLQVTPDAEHKPLPQVPVRPSEFPGLMDMRPGAPSPRLAPRFSWALNGQESDQLGERLAGRARGYSDVSLHDENNRYHSGRSSRRSSRCGTLAGDSEWGSSEKDDSTLVNQPQSNRHTWLSIAIIVLSFYSTAMSALWFITAIVQPRWGRAIHSGGILSPSTASLLSALFAKTIEISFVTVFITYLGQVLSRRSSTMKSKGITLAEMNMRNWIVQPGSLLTSARTMRYAGRTFLGLVSLLATMVAMLFTTASDALVSPKMKFGGWENRRMQGMVKASYANPTYVTDQCQSLVPKADDVAFGGTTCLSLEYAGQSFHDYILYTEEWNNIRSNNITASLNMTQRPQAVGILFDNTTVTGNWIEQSDMQVNFAKYSRIINNVTMAMPHAGVFQAARDDANNIIQPELTQGTGAYSIRASVPSPSVNVLCANMYHNEIAPLIYTEWPNAKTNTSDVPGQRLAWPGWRDDVPKAGSNQTWLNSTIVDGVFRWGSQYKRRPPVFPMFPMNYNSVVNVSIYEGDSIYILTKSPSISQYTLCSLRSFLSPKCSTQYNVTGASAGALGAHCEDPSDNMMYLNSKHNAPTSFQAYNIDWPNLVSLWAFALSFGEGLTNGNASNARLLSQLVPITPHLPTETPSIAEALAVMAGGTLLTGSTDTPFVHFWNYTTNILDNPTYQFFNATVRSQQYTSGFVQNWQAVFFLVLGIVMLLNIWCLAHFLWHDGFVMDFTDPVNLFTVALLSDKRGVAALHPGASGPRDSMWGTGWIMKSDEGGQVKIKRLNKDGVMEEGEDDLGGRRRAATFTSEYDLLVKNRLKRLSDNVPVRASTMPR